MPDTILRFGAYTLDAATLELQLDGLPVALPRIPSRLLRELASNANRLVPRQQLIDLVWPDVTVTDASLATAIRAIRRTLTSMAPGHSIETRRGQGYVFVGNVEHARRACPSLPGTAAPGSLGHDYVGGAHDADRAHGAAVSADSVSRAYSADSAGAAIRADGVVSETSAHDESALPEQASRAWRAPRISASQLKRLHPDTRKLVDAAAVVGPAVHPNVAREVSGLTVERMRAALAEAERLGILAVEAERAIRFSRPENRATVDAAIAPDRRAVLEAAAADLVLDFADDAPCRGPVSEQLAAVLALLDRTRVTLESLDSTLNSATASSGQAAQAQLPGRTRVELARIALALEGDLERAQAFALERLEAAALLVPESSEPPRSIGSEKLRAAS